MGFFDLFGAKDVPEPPRGGDAPSAAVTARLARKLSLLADALNVRVPDVGDGLPSEVRAAAATGNKIEAIKLYRERTGVGLAEAKAAVDRGEATPPAPLVSAERTLDAILRDLGIDGGAGDAPRPAASALADGMADVEAAVRRGRMIEAIKLYRDRTGVDLKHAVEAVEAIRVSLNRDER